MSGINDQQLDAWRAFLTAHARIVAVMAKQMNDLVGLPLSWYEVLLILYESDTDRCRMSELADTRLLSRSAATRLVDRMEKADLVERCNSDDDRRGVAIMMTDTGRERFLAAGRIHLDGIKKHFGDRITTEEADLLSRLMWRLAEVG